MSHLLIVEDDEGLREGLRRNFEYEGYQVSTAADGFAGLEAAVTLGPQLLILDVMLPGLNGFDVCRRLRADGATTPILLLTVRKEEPDRVLGFDVGADDYVLKPFSVQELSGRVRALLRRSQGGAAELSRLRLGAVEVDFARQQVSRRGRQLKLSFREYELLRYLAGRRGEVVTREDLMKHVLGYSPEATSRAVDNLIVHLRKKIEVDPRAPRHILTAYGIGYKLVV
jgi:two-component system, OmpR family, alkaline phosphatase synthesis response regulator PhoP